VRNNLIGTFLRAALQETGAQRALLILSRRNEHRIAAEATRSGEKIVERFCDEAVTESLLPESVLHYVGRTRETVVIDEAATRAKFGADPYFRQHKAGSILCLPLLNRTNLIGALILEGHQSGVFTRARIAVLKPVASLAAMALENSRLCVDLRQREARVRRLVDANIMGIYIVDIRGPILESNDAYLRMLGYERGDLDSGRLRWTDLTPPEWHAADKQRVERIKRVGRLQPFEKEFFRKDGTRVPVLMGVARFKEPRTQAMVFALDLSKQKRAEAVALESRMIEQTRIARKSHDALLQNFQGMIFRFQAARNLLAQNPDEALQSLNEAIKEGEMALDESRDTIQNLRFGPTTKRISGKS
jgi:PAS domain S-box-containing protein